jgi:hypothetical protein
MLSWYDRASIAVNLVANRKHVQEDDNGLGDIGRVVFRKTAEKYCHSMQAVF